MFQPHPSFASHASEHTLEVPTALPVSDRAEVETLESDAEVSIVAV